MNIIQLPGIIFAVLREGAQDILVILLSHSMVPCFFQMLVAHKAPVTKPAAIMKNATYSMLTEGK